jgi:hypothetical protein
LAIASGWKATCTAAFSGVACVLADGAWLELEEKRD